MKISHKELESCRTSPAQWVASKLSASGSPRMGYQQALRLAICEFHKSDDLEAASLKLDSYVAKNFKNEAKIERLYERMTAYAEWFTSSGVISAEANILLNYPSSTEWRLGGYVSRVDFTKSGYRAVLFEVPGVSWKRQLRMPLIQQAIADRYGRPAKEIRIGIQNLEDNSLSDTRFGLDARKSALSEFIAIGSKVAGLWPQKN